MSVTTWTTNQAYLYCEIITQAYAVARGGGVKNFFGVWHFRRDNVLSPVSKTNIASSFESIIGSTILAAVNVDYTQIANTVRFFENPLDAPTAFAVTGVGAIAGDRLPDFNCVTLQLHSGVRGKAYRGSKHFGPISEDDTTGDDLKTTPATRFTAIGAAAIAGFNDGDGNLWTPGLKGGERFGSPAQYESVPTTTVWTDIIAFRLNKSLGTMKRRKIKTVN
jgi:hypothetical protein